MIHQLIEYDKELFLFLNNLGSPVWDNLWLLITDKLTSIPLYIILLYLIYKKLGAKPLVIIVIMVTLLIVFTDQSANLFKRSFERPRPCRAEGVMEYMRFLAKRCGLYGFFSGHAANSMGVAVFTGLMLKPYYRNLIFLLLFWSVVVAYSRIYVGVHYPLDIICGFAFGALSGFMFYKFSMHLMKRFIN